MRRRVRREKKHNSPFWKGEEPGEEAGEEGKKAQFTLLEGLGAG